MRNKQALATIPIIQANLLEYISYKKRFLQEIILSHRKIRLFLHSSDEKKFDAAIVEAEKLQIFIRSEEELIMNLSFYKNKETENILFAGIKKIELQELTSISMIRRKFNRLGWFGSIKIQESHLEELRQNLQGFKDLILWHIARE